MARRSGGRPTPRPAARSRIPPPQPARHAPLPAVAQPGGGSMLGGIGSTIVQGMALGTGSAISHQAMDAVMGPNTVQHEYVVFFGPNYLSGSSLPDTTQMDVVVPLLLHFLDERDGTARAVVMLMAEYCFVSTKDHCLKEVLKRVASGNASQRRNAIDVVSEIISISSNSVCVNTHVTWQDIAYRLLECLGDEEVVIREQASNLLPMIDPSLMLPTLVRLVYSSEESVQSCATNALIGVLRHNNSKFEVICQLLDCLSNLHRTLDLPEVTGQVAEGSKLATDRVFRLISEWSKSVKDWKALIGPLLDKMFAELSNAIVVRFQSLISEHLVEVVDDVLDRVLLLMKGRDEVDEYMVSRTESRTYTSKNSVKMEQCLA